MPRIRNANSRLRCLFHSTVAILLIATILLSCFSYPFASRVTRGVWYTPYRRDFHFLDLIIHRGTLQAIWQTHISTDSDESPSGPVSGWRFGITGSDPKYRPQSAQPTEINALGLRWLRDVHKPDQFRTTNAYVIALPLPFLLAPITFFLIRAWRAYRHSPSPTLCPHCHYDLRATPTRCPECGHTAPA